MYCGVSFLASSNYYYDRNGLSAGAIAGIVGGILSFFLIGTLLIVTVIRLRHLYMKQQNHTSTVTQQPTATSHPNPLPPPAYDEKTQHPPVYYINSTGRRVFASAPRQFSQNAEPPPRYTTRPQPRHAPTTQPQSQHAPPPQLPYVQLGYSIEPPPEPDV